MTEKMNEKEKAREQEREAIEEIIRNSNDWLTTMKELIDKATPKKPNYEGDGYSNGELVYDTWICPNCDERYEVGYDDYRYCPNCGQALDLSDLQ